MPSERILVSLGLTDLDGMTERVVRALIEHPAPLSIDVVLGASSSNSAEIAAIASLEPRVYLHVDPPYMAAYMAAADLAIGGG